MTVPPTSTNVDFGALGPNDDPYIYLDPYETDLRHFLSSDQVSVREMEEYCRQAEIFRQRLLKGKHPVKNKAQRKLLKRKTVHVVFDQVSTRTKHSSGYAARKLRCHVERDDTLEFSSSSDVKGETYEHLIMTLGSFHLGPDAGLLVVRNKLKGFALRAARVSSIPVINAGDGSEGEHPTQTVGDVITIKHHLGRLDGLTIVITGDPGTSRVIRSNLKHLAKYPGNRFVFFSPPHLRLADDMRAELTGLNVQFEEYFDREHLHAAMANADVVYGTRAQNEYRADTKQSSEDPFKLDWADADVMKPGSILMHPMPISGGFAARLDFHPRSVYVARPGLNDGTNQVTCGMLGRMTIITDLLLP
jgi:aspartate carbamoyltransferase catalytic subunit